MANMGGYILVEVMLWLMYAILLLALIAVVASAVHSLRHRYDSIAASNRVPRKTIAWGVAGLTVLLLLVACLAGSSQPLLINGISYTDRFWLKATDGVIVSSLVLIVIAACFVVYGMSGINRKLKGK